MVRLVSSLLVAAFFCTSASWPVVRYSLFLTDFLAYLTWFLSVLDVEFFTSLFFSVLGVKSSTLSVLLSSFLSKFCV